MALFAVFTLCSLTSLGQTGATSTTPAPTSFAKPNTMPPYVLYRHFLSWVTQLDNAATAAGASDPYQFAQAFSRAGLQNPHLDLRASLGSDVSKQLDANYALDKAAIIRHD
jgi:hypothetical protein